MRQRHRTKPTTPGDSRQRLNLTGARTDDRTEVDRTADVAVIVTWNSCWPYPTDGPPRPAMGGDPEFGEGDPALNLYQMGILVADVLADSGAVVAARLLAEIRGSRPWRVGSDSDACDHATCRVR